MGAIKDIYDILADIATKVEARRLQKRESRSREEAVAYATSLEVSVSELHAKVSDLEREHAEEVASLNNAHAEEVASLKAQITQLQSPPTQRGGKRPIRNWR